MTTATERPPFAGMAGCIPARYAPGHHLDAYPYPKGEIWDPTVWYPVIYVAATDEDKAVWLVEPFPAARADGIDGCDPAEQRGPVGVCVVRGNSLPLPRTEGDVDGDWIVAGTSLTDECAYDVYVATQPQLMAAWCEAYAIAAALNNGTAERYGVQPEDVEVLLAAERGALVGDSRFAGTINELKYARLDTTGGYGRRSRVPARQASRLRTCRAGGRGRPNPAFIEPATTTEEHPTREGASAPYVTTTYTLTRMARSTLAAIRRQYDGPTRCRVCGQHDDRGTPTPNNERDQKAWIAPDLCAACG